MAAQDRLNIANMIIKKYTDVVQCFDDFITLVKAGDLEKAETKANYAKVLRIEIFELTKQYEKLNKKSGIVLVNNKIKSN